MCNLTTQWAVPSNGPLNAGSVREINSGVSPSKNMINTPAGDAAEDEVGAAGSGSVGTRGEAGGVGGAGASAAEQRGQRVGHTGSRGKGRQGKGNLGQRRQRDPPDSPTMTPPPPTPSERSSTSFCKGNNARPLWILPVCCPLRRAVSFI